MMNKTLFRFLLIVLVGMAIYAGLKEIPWKKIFHIDDVNIEIGKEFGDQMWDAIQQQETLDTNERNNHLVDTLVDIICLQTGGNKGKGNQLKREDFKVHVIVKDQVNAFAMPGGHLVVHTGLIEACKSPEQLAGVLAHEMTHITQEHVTKKLVKEVGLGVLASIVGGNGEIVREVLRHLSSTAYDRSLEKEADLMGAEMLHNVGINPEGMAEFMDYMANLPESKAMENLDWLSTHPDSKDRATEIREAAKKFGPNKKYMKLNVGF
jgi:predicted Zn-dependent protease